MLAKGSFEEDLNKAIYNLKNAIKYHTNTYSGRMSADKYINLLDSSAFSENLWNTLVCILRGHADNTYIPETMYELAIDLIQQELAGANY